MVNKWYKVGKGLQAYNHKSRKYGKRFDRYIRGRYMVDGKINNNPFGWESDFAKAERSRLQAEGGGVAKRSFLEFAAGELERLRANAKAGTGPATLKEDKALADEKAKAEEDARLLKERDAITFGEYFEKVYYPIAKTSKKQRSHVQEISHFRLWLNPVIGKMWLKDIRPINLERVKKNLLEKSRSPRMIQYVFATGRQCWNFARRDGLVPREWPGKEVKLPKVENKRMRFLTDAEGDLLLEGLKERSQQLHDICLLSFDSGLRADEIFSLRWNRVDLVQNSVKVFDSKGKDRVVFLTGRTVDMLQGLPKDGLVFKSRTGEKITEISNSFDREVNDLGWNDGIKSRKDKLVFHSLRHSFASRLVARGIDLYVVSQLLGHSDLSMTQRYSHLRPDTLQAAVNSLEHPEREEEAQSKVVKLRANNDQ